MIFGVSPTLSPSPTHASSVTGVPSKSAVQLYPVPTGLHLLTLSLPCRGPDGAVELAVGAVVSVCCPPHAAETSRTTNTTFFIRRHLTRDGARRTPCIDPKHSYPPVVRAFFLFVSLAGAGCTQVIADDFLPPDASSPFRPDATLPDAFAGDAAAETTVFNGGGDFMCGKCVCDGTLYLCHQTEGTGTANAPTDLDASADADADADEDADAAGMDAGPPMCAHDAGACMQIPIECLPKPTCDCILPSPGDCTCSVDPSGNGFQIECIAP